MTDTTFAIVGASLAGAKAAEELRERGFDGRIVLIGAEPDRPYERPPLSKEFVRGEQERDKAFVHDQGFYDEHQIELRTRTTVTSLDTAHSKLTLEDGDVLDYDQLLLTTGAEPRRSRCPALSWRGSTTCARSRTPRCCAPGWPRAAAGSSSSAAAGSAQSSPPRRVRAGSRWH